MSTNKLHYIFVSLFVTFNLSGEYAKIINLQVEPNRMLAIPLPEVAPGYWMIGSGGGVFSIKEDCGFMGHLTIGFRGNTEIEFRTWEVLDSLFLTHRLALGSFKIKIKFLDLKDPWGRAYKLAWFTGRTFTSTNIRNYVKYVTELYKVATIFSVVSHRYKFCIGVSWDRAQVTADSLINFTQKRLYSLSITKNSVFSGVEVMSTPQVRSFLEVFSLPFVDYSPEGIKMSLEYFVVVGTRTILNQYFSIDTGIKYRIFGSVADAAIFFNINYGAKFQ